MLLFSLLLELSCIELSESSSVKAYTSSKLLPSETRKIYITKETQNWFYGLVGNLKIHLLYVATSLFHCLLKTNSGGQCCGCIRLSTVYRYQLWVPVALLLIQPHDNMLEKAEGHTQSPCDPDTHIGDSEVSGSHLHPGPIKPLQSTI